jgi:hypothetical protein
MGEETEYFSFSNFHLRQPLCFFFLTYPLVVCPKVKRKALQNKAITKKALADRKILVRFSFLQ